MKQIFLLAIGLSLMGCQKDIDEFIPDQPAPVQPAPFDGRVTNLLLELLSVQTFSLDAAQAASFRTNKGVQITVPAGAWIDEDGLPVSGPVEVELTEAFKKGEMIAGNIPTSADNHLLDLLSAVHLKASQHERELELAAQVTVRIRIPVTEYLPEARLYNGIQNSDQGITWLAVDNESNDSLAILNPVSYYDSLQQEWIQAFEYSSGQPGWSGIGETMWSDQEQSAVCVALPAGYNQENTAVFLAFEASNSVVRLPWASQNSIGQFCLDKSPAGKAGILISLSERTEGIYQLAFKNINTGSGTQTVNLKPEDIPLEEIRAFLSNL